MTRIGIDRENGHFLVARIDDSSGRIMVEQLTTMQNGGLPGNEILSGGKLVSCVPDSDVIVRPVYLPNVSIADDDSPARFELAMSMLEPEDTFAFRIIPTGLDFRYLGLVFRRERLADLDNSIGVGHIDGYPSDGYQSRAVALGQGYLAFCRRHPGELLCIVDLDKAGTSICFIFREHVVSVGHLPACDGDLSDDKSVRRLAVELKTVINFRLMSLASDGISVPMSVLILTGEDVDERVRKIFGELFPSGVVEPQINRSFLGENVTADIPAERYLVALGLVAN